MKKKVELKLPSSQRTLCIIDGFRAQCTTDIVKLLDHHGIDIVYVPAKCTGELQPLDLSVNKPVKTLLSKDFRNGMPNKLFSKKKMAVPSSQ